MKDSEALFKATLNIYRDSLALSIKGCLVNWHLPLVHLFLLMGVMIIGQVAQIFGRVAGGFLFGLVVAAIMAFYFSQVRAVADGEKVRYLEFWSLMTSIFFPIINVLFLIFIFNFVFSMLLSRPGSEWLMASINLVIAVLFNPLPEVLSKSRGYAMQVLAECIEFIRDNFIEWYIPIFVLLSPLLLMDASEVFHITMFVLSTNPMQLLEAVFLGLGPMVLMIGNIFLILIIFYAIFLIFVFRAVLYSKLSSSTRRKRIYQFKHG